MRRNSIALSRRHQIWLYVSLGLLLVTGLVWAAFRWNLGEDQIHPSQPWLLRLHGAAAMVALILLGTLIPLHIKGAWKARKNRGSGGGMLAWFGFVTVTGYGLYYSGGETMRQFTGWSHLGVGALLVPLLAWHVAAGRRLARAKRPGGVQTRGPE